MSAHTTATPDFGTPPPIAVPSGMWRNLSLRPRPQKLPKGLDAFWIALVAIVVPWVPRRQIFLRQAQKVVALEKEYANLNDRRLREAAMQMRDLFRLGRETSENRIHALAGPVSFSKMIWRSSTSGRARPSSVPLWWTLSKVCKPLVTSWVRRL